ncbi:MAG: cupredoxin domain-containing protein [Dechloromonas sp.]|jgi:plastocyanin|nr:cupredoxin domain-containing protein [Dechloromonas sp.]MBN8462161.1 cupredoxin domain-containing protein [Dechloromonas sp.]
MLRARKPTRVRAGTLLSRRAPAVLALVSFSLFAGQTVEVGIEKYTYTPAEVTIRVGDTVKWINREKRTSHSILFPQEGGRESERLFPDESWQREFTRAGRYPYTCGPHPEMKGVVIVVE